MGKLKIASIGSSSSGNAYIVSDGNTRLLLDVGLTAKRIKEGLAECRLGVEDIQGIFITHEHTDHVKASGQSQRLVRMRKCIHLEERYITVISLNM